MPSEEFEDVLEFWLRNDHATMVRQFEWWFCGGADSAIAERFSPLLERATRGDLDDWAQAPRSRLALIIVLDQFSRSLYRDTARAFAQDSKALALCRLLQHSASQARGHRDIIARFGRHPHRAKSDHQYGVVRLIHPEAGDCSAAERSASSSPAAREEWQKCFQTLSTWLIRWADRIRFAEVKFADCELKRVPVTLRESGDDWWLWWVPLPHIGGKPLSYLNLTINVNGANCTAVGGPAG